MKPTNVLSLWIAAFAIKAIGASWDASFHFKYLRETTQYSHIVNTIGLVLACLLWLYMARQLEYKLTKPLKVSGLGFIVFFVGIPLDEAWHRIFGIDLTTWSLTHSILYAGTALMIAGTILQVEAYYAERMITRSRRIVCLAFLLIYVLEAFWFPLLQQEQGVISLYLFDHGIPIASKDIIELLTNPVSQIYGGIPNWLYGVYACFATMVVFRIIRHFQIGRFSCTVIAGGYVGFRALMNFIYGSAAYPQSTVPYFLLFAAVIADLVYLSLNNKISYRYIWLIITVEIVCCVYAVSFFNPEFPIHPPMPIASALAALFSTMIGYGVASFLIYLLNAAFNRPSTKPSLTNVNHGGL
jgi:hypothetical protein